MRKTSACSKLLAIQQFMFSQLVIGSKNGLDQEPTSIMHEFSFAEQILEAVISESRGYPGSKVTAIRIRATSALGLEMASLRFALETLAHGTQAQGAILNMQTEHPQMDCPVCGRVEVENIQDAICPQCGRVGKPTRATELIIEEIELDE